MTLMRWMLLAAALLSKTAWAEVMDKEMPLAQVVGFGLVANVTAYLAARLKTSWWSGGQARKRVSTPGR